MATDPTALEAVLKELLPAQHGDRGRAIAMVAACAGTHFRSMAMACLAMKSTVSGIELTVPLLLQEIFSTCA